MQADVPEMPPETDAATEGPPEPDALTEMARLDSVESAADWLDALLAGLPGWGRAAAIIAAAVLVLFMVQTILFAILRRSTKRDDRAAAAHLVEKTGTPSRALAVVAGLGLGLSVASARGLTADWIEPIWPRAINVAVVLSLTWLIVGVIAGADDLILAKHRVDVRDNLKARRMHTQVAVISKFLRIIAVIIGVAVALTTFDGVERIGTSLLASAGIAGIAIGFAAKSVLGNLIAGIQIALTQPIRLDDAVVIAGEWGWIEEITTTYVVVRVWDQRRLIVPFSTIIEQPFQNWTRNNSEITGAVEIYVDYACDISAVRDELDRIVEGHEKWDGRAKVLQVTDATERTIKLRVLVTASDSPTAWDLRCDVRERLVRWLRSDHPEWLPRERQLNLEPSSGESAALHQRESQA
jgi:small-conductance mechanosensitive channel